MPVPAVEVTVAGQSNGVSRTVTTDADGAFVVSNLPPGTVDLTAAAAGFNEVSRKGLVLEVGMTLSLDLALSLGSVRETVTDARSSIADDTTVLCAGAARRSARVGSRRLAAE